MTDTRPTGSSEEDQGGDGSGALRPARSLERLADEDLMQVAGETESRAFELVYDRHAGAAYSLAYRVLGSRAAARVAAARASSRRPRHPSPRSAT